MERDRYTPLTVSVPPAFFAYCRGHGAEPSDVLRAFMADLAPTTESGTSLDRGRAAQWFHAIKWGQPRWDDEGGPDL